MHQLKKRRVIGIVIDILLWLIATAPAAYLFLRGKPIGGAFICRDPSLSFPVLEDTVPVATLLAVCIAVPVITFMLTECLTGTKKIGCPGRTCISSVLRQILTLLFGAAVTFSLTMGLKITVSKPRPFFLTACAPNYAKINCTAGFVREFECTSGAPDMVISDSLQSFPSGHASMSAFTMMYLVIYLEYRLRIVFSDFLKPAVQLVFIALAGFCSVSRYFDYKHDWADVMFGFALGITVAVFCGRKMARRKQLREEAQESGDHDTRKSENQV